MVAAGSGALAMASPGWASPAASATRRPAAKSALPVVTLEQLSEGKSLGTKHAPILLEEFTDFQCPACKLLFEGTTEQVIRNYVDTGKVYLVHHDFPLAGHAHSREAARWANAAAAIGKFEPVEAALFAQQDNWGATGNIQAALNGVLTGPEMKRVSALVNDPEIELSIQKDYELGLQRHVMQTPSLFVTHNGITSALPPGPVTYPILKQYLDYLLTQ
jgi:protein-disulfide isomerase